MLDKDFIRRKVKLIQEDLARLDSLSEYSFEDIAKDFTKTAVVERCLERIIMRAIDINQHIVAELGKGIERMRGYEDTFHALAGLGVYDDVFAKAIAPSVGLRNRLVHEYNDTKQEIIYKSVGKAVEQYAQYCKYILEFIESK